MLPSSAVEMAALVRGRRVGVEVLVRHHLEVIARRDPNLGVFVERLEARALRAARALDRELGRRSSWAGDARWPAFFGLPTGIKDDSPLRFTFMRVGSRALRWTFVPFDGPVAAACRQAGFVFLGKLATSELTILPFVDGALHPPTRNPHDPTRYAGGSSGGSGAAVASGMLPIAPGSDGAGSIRIPASFCGLVGMKPSRGTLPHAFAHVDPVGLSSTGPLARNVRDAAALLDVMAGDPWHHEPLRPGSFLAGCDQPPPPGLRIRVGLRTPLAEVDPEVEACVRRAAARLEAMGHVVDEGAPIDGGLDEFLPLMQRIVANAPLPPGVSGWLEPTTRWMREQGRRYGQAEVRERHAALAARVEAWWGDADFWILPTVPYLPPPVGAYAGLDGEATLRAAAPLGAFTAPFNVSGQPAVSLPAGRSAGGLPIGVQLVGRVGEDRRLLGLCAVLEEALGEDAERPAAASVAGAAA